MNELRTGLSYGDVLLVPKRSPVDSRSDIDLSTPLTPTVELDTPLVSAAMDTVTEAELAIELGQSGGFGVLHRFLTPEEQAEQVEQVTEAGEQVGAAVGINEDYVARSAAVITAGVDALVVDVAHGHLNRALDAVETLADEFPDADIIAGNVATPAGVEDLAAAGADCVKVGIGPGSHCTTRKVAGAGVPQLTAVDDCATAAEDLDVTICADGGIRTSGDAVKALMAGADTVMLGSLFAGTEEAPGVVVEVDGTRYKRSRGMATTAAAEDRDDKQNNVSADEGVEALTPYKGSVAAVAEEFCAGIRSGLSYCGGHTIAAARDKAEFIRVAQSAKEREGFHTDHDWEGVNVESEATQVRDAGTEATVDSDD
ncbi:MULTISPECIES: guanosine monophosphate reductase [Haloarcula]|mgnify:FL=1|jgi:IMP dehydrogenase|uniref:Guanosine monophosphate reductase n=2 Tax=Haloarcula marismortui TaxID=2238 RepID=Q5V6J1_HALMA|nr:MULTISPECIES: guanosine monophosphate reductase [Haloarcula]AAV44861.1 inosine-5'-monophosphate dehydrogenase [Haloarcula marismortui ATCC 43049]EMA21485.1 inosine-5'-monophosphate dehydrogenase [Haloarcula californiae ATCC 33799]NHN63556.1 guanosine monophosphate reductase [Haloarcula sp. JP-Z28]QCP90171.1 guanosine monophosphate reductase [Haloarcula marismortui ATCC 43049]